MSLTTYERKTLLAYQKFREKSPTFPQLFIRVIPRFAFIALLAIVAYYIFSASAGIFVAGMFAGGLLRQLSILWTSTKVFPILTEVIDWDLVADLLEAPNEG